MNLCHIWIMKEFIVDEEKLSIKSLLKIIEELREENFALRSALLERDAIIDHLNKRINQLEERLKRNSQNSNQPPSTDQYERKSKPKSERQKSGKKPGGQPGHRGFTMQPTQNPDTVINYGVSQCELCKHDLSDVQVTEYLSRQECDIPPVMPRIIEHRMASKICPKCKFINKAKGPEYLKQPIQYGPRVSAFATYLHYDQLLPLQRIQRLFSDLFSLPLSEGTLVNIHEKFCTQLRDSEAKIRENLLTSCVNNCDETSMYINGKTQWLHVVSNDTNTSYFIHKKRGSEAMDAMNILPQYNGVIVHDHWKPYFIYNNMKHSLCNAHHIRELRGIHEIYDQPWAQEMRQLLLDINRTVDKYKDAGKSKLPTKILTHLSEKYDAILNSAQSQIPSVKILSNGSKKRGRIKQHPAKNLFDRLTKQKQETLRFMYDFNVPFTNNQAERDVRMAKLKQKVSGCFRSQEGAGRFCRIRGYISTSRKRGINILQSLENAIRGQPKLLIS